MKPILTIPALALLALASSCNSMRNAGPTAVQTPVPAPEAVASTAADDAKKLTGEWSVTQAGGQNIVVNGDNHPKLTLEPAQGESTVLNVIGFNGCNYLNGMWSLEAGSKLKPAGEFLSSLKSCPDAPWESVFNIAVNEAASYGLEGENLLTLYSATGRPVMKLERNTLAFLNGAWRVTSIDSQPVSAGIKIVIDTDELRLHGNAGCNVLNGDITVNLDKPAAIEFKNLATSRMTCPDIAVEQAFLLALESVDTAAPGTDPGQAVLKNVAGQTVITLSRLAPGELVDD